MDVAANPWYPNLITVGMSDGAVHVLEPLEDWSAVPSKYDCRLDGNMCSAYYSACLLDIQSDKIYRFYAPVTCTPTLGFLETCAQPHTTIMDLLHIPLGCVCLLRIFALY